MDDRTLALVPVLATVLALAAASLANAICLYGYL